MAGFGLPDGFRGKTNNVFTKHGDTEKKRFYFFLRVSVVNQRFIFLSITYSTLPEIKLTIFIPF